MVFNPWFGCNAGIFRTNLRLFMERTSRYNVIDWKNNPRRKPLIVRGARQVGN